MIMAISRLVEVRMSQHTSVPERESNTATSSTVEIQQTTNHSTTTTNHSDMQEAEAPGGVRGELNRYHDF